MIEENATVLFTSEASSSFPDDELQFISDGIIRLTFSQYGRFLAISKFRGSDFIKGEHSFKITTHGIKIFPKLVAKEHIRRTKYEKLSFGISDLDKITGGGLELGTITFLAGNSGTGKTTLALQFAKENASKGYRAVLYSFDEKVEIIKERAKLINMEIDNFVKNNMLIIEKVDPLQYTPDEFAFLIRKEVENNGTKIVVIDSISGYKLSIQGEDLETHLKALTAYLSNMNVACLAIIELSNIVGDFSLTDMNISYMADNIIFLRYLEINGELKKAIGVIKKRLSDFEKTLREFSITKNGIVLGKPLVNLRGILLGVPTWINEK